MPSPRRPSRIPADNDRWIGRLERGIEGSRTDWKRRIQRNALRFSNLAERMTLGPLTPDVHTPSRVVFRWDMATLNRYLGPRVPTQPAPILIIPPLMVKPSVFDLWVGHSFVGRLVQAGFDVFVVDFGIPKREHRRIKIDHYITDFIREAHLRLLKETGAPAATLLGWSMGGIMSCLYNAYWHPDQKVDRMVVLGSPIDFSRQFPFHQLARLAGTPLMRLIDAMGNIPAFLIRNTFKAMAPVQRVTRYATLWNHYHDRAFIGVYESLNDWVDDFIPYPADAFKQFLDDYFRRDKLKRGELRVAGRRINLGVIGCPIFVVVGLNDTLARSESVKALKELVAHPDRVEFLEVPLGHIGLMAGRSAPREVWDPIVRWLESPGKPGS